MADPKPEMLTVRLNRALHALLEEATTLMPYRVTKTAILERGIVLAVEEMKAMAGDGGRDAPLSRASMAMTDLVMAAEGILRQEDWFDELHEALIELEEARARIEDETR